MQRADKGLETVREMFCHDKVEQITDYYVIEDEEVDKSRNVSGPLTSGLTL